MMIFDSPENWLLSGGNRSEKVCHRLTCIKPIPDLKMRKEILKEGTPLIGVCIFYQLHKYVPEVLDPNVIVTV